MSIELMATDDQRRHIIESNLVSKEGGNDLCGCGWEFKVLGFRLIGFKEIYEYEMFFKDDDLPSRHDIFIISVSYSVGYK